MSGLLGCDECLMEGLYVGKDDSLLNRADEQDSQAINNEQFDIGNAGEL